MRTIKFRVWDKTNEIMWQPALKMESDRPQRLALDVPISDDIQPKPPYIWLQYTGLLDKNGKEIYEGDIVRNIYAKDNGFKDTYHDDNEVIEWNTEYAKFGCGDFMDLGEAYNDQDTTLEVIGNIYESPELLTAPIKEKK